MNWVGSGDSSRTSIPKIMASYPPPPPPYQLSLVEDVRSCRLSILKKTPSFRWIPFSGFRGEDENVSANRRPGWPSCFSNRPEKHKLGRRTDEFEIHIDGLWPGLHHTPICPVWRQDLKWIFVSYDVLRKSCVSISQSIWDIKDTSLASYEMKIYFRFFLSDD